MQRAAVKACICNRLAPAGQRLISLGHTTHSLGHLHEARGGNDELSFRSNHAKSASACDLKPSMQVTHASPKPFHGNLRASPGCISHDPRMLQEVQTDMFRM